MSKFQKIIVILFVIIALSVLYFFVIRPNIQNQSTKEEDANPVLIIKSISEKEEGDYSISNGIVRYYDDIDKLISSKDGYSSKINIYTEANRAPISYNELILLPNFKSTVNSIKKYLEKKGFTKSDSNSVNSTNVDDFGEYFEGYENGNTKCSIQNYIGESSEDLEGKTYTPLKITCADNFEKQKALQIQLLDIMGDDSSGIYIDKEGGGFIHANSMGHGFGGVEMIFRKVGIGYELIYEGNSGISCSIVNQYNIPFYIAGECY